LNQADRSLSGRLTAALGDAYSVEGEIGRGGMGVVYKARDERLKRGVAIKVLPPELAFREEIRLRFLREAETAARLSHPHIVPIHTVGEGPDGLVYFVMAFVDGESLGQRMKRRGRLPSEEARRILMETADALGAAHALGIIHRDVKPDNILLEGSRGRVVVTDFGIAKALSSTTGGGTLTATGVAIGTPHFMSPEQAAGDREIDGRSDLYSLGVCGYQALTGELPFNAPTVPGILMKQITEAAPAITSKRPDCPEDLEGSVMRCLEKEPEHRWPTAEALRRALESRSAPAYRPRASARRSPIQPTRGPGDLVPRSPDLGRRLSRRARKKDEEKEIGPGGEPNAVRKMRSAFVSWASVSGGLGLLDVLQGGGLSWSLWVAVPWLGFSLFPRYMKLWDLGYSWRDVLNRPAAPSAQENLRGGSGTRQIAASGDEFGRNVAVIQQARQDRLAIVSILEKLPASERKMLPDVMPTVDALMKRAEELARVQQSMSAGVDDAATRRIDDKIESVKQQTPGAERDRQLGLLERQRQALGDLTDRRKRVEDQIESCVLAMQNVRFDLLRLKSAGVAAVLDDLTQATQAARSLSRDVDHAIAAAGEIREVLGQSPKSGS
jgi:serine/threonine protein kinase